MEGVPRGGDRRTEISDSDGVGGITLERNSGIQFKPKKNSSEGIRRDTQYLRPFSFRRSVKPLSHYYDCLPCVHLDFDKHTSSIFIISKCQTYFMTFISNF